MNRAGQLVLLVTLMVLPVELVQAQGTEDQWWPELRTYVKLNPKARLSLFAKRSTDGNTYNSVAIGPNFDVFLKPLRKRLRTNDAAKQRYLSFRVGYRHFSNVDGPDENRGILELTPRALFPWSILISDRNRADLRWVEAEKFRWRYRNRFTLERSFKISWFSFNPYAEGEVYYYSRYGDWAKNSYAFGVHIPLGRRVEVKPYFQRDNQSRTSPQHVNAFGFICSLYF